MTKAVPSAPRKNFLFVPKIPITNNFLEKIYSEFEKLSFGTQSNLFLLFESREKIDWWIPMKYSRAKAVYRDEIALDEFIKQIDCYITGDNPDELPVIEVAWKNRIEILSFQREGLNVFQNFPHDPNAEIFKSNLQKIIEDQLLKKFPLEEYEYILAQYGFGESTVLFFMLREFKLQRRKKICALSVDESRYQMMLHCPYVDIAARIPFEVSQYLATFYPVKNLSKLHCNPRLIQLRNSNPPLQHFEPAMIFYMRHFLEIDPLTKFSRYHVEIPPESLKNARNLFESMKLREGKTIFLVTRGNYYRHLNHQDFFIELARKFQDSGFDVVTNSSRQEIPNVPNVMLTLWDNVAFVRICRNVVSIPTGWAEVSCALNESVPIQFHVILPGMYDEFHRTSPGFLWLLQLHGKKFVDSTLKDYELLMKNILPPNIDLHLHTFPESNEEILKQIAR